MVLHFLFCSCSFCCHLGIMISIQSGKLRLKNPGHTPFSLADFSLAELELEEYPENIIQSHLLKIEERLL